EPNLKPERNGTRQARSNLESHQNNLHRSRYGQGWCGSGPKPLLTPLADECQMVMRRVV
ncbi:hypothetical protein A2U01_0034692, partial [Trifolium medium]|nr:hypothetical protein [Trifolium medium]